ncbi:MAG: hypothetical protein HC797_05485 [Anaerolineales bacterium]|nr:hypothetical protein [Anaerolineales bacterium]
MLYKNWLKSDSFDELRLIPSIICEGEWKNQPQVTRKFLMNLINRIPQNNGGVFLHLSKILKKNIQIFKDPQVTMIRGLSDVNLMVNTCAGSLLGIL